MFTCYFLTNTEENASNVRVYNKYFNVEEDFFENPKVFDHYRGRWMGRVIASFLCNLPIDIFQKMWYNYYRKKERHIQ